MMTMAPCNVEGRDKQNFAIVSQNPQNQGPNSMGGSIVLCYIPSGWSIANAIAPGIPIQVIGPGNLSSPPNFGVGSGSTATVQAAPVPLQTPSGGTVMYQPMFQAQPTQPQIQFQPMTNGANLNHSLATFTQPANLNPDARSFYPATTPYYIPGLMPYYWRDNQQGTEVDDESIVGNEYYQ